MIGGRLEESLGDPSALLHLAADVLVEERAGGCRKLLVAAAWADCHGAPDDHAVGERQSMLVDRFVRMGGLGTPLVLESAPAELAVVLGTSVVGARQLIGDVLTLRHRLPMLWARVVTGEVWAWKARQIAQRTAHLVETSSREVDRLIAPFVEQLAWGRFENCLDATLLQVDEKTYQARAEQAAGKRDARLQRGEDGLAVLIARMAAGDGTAFMALVNRVAECLADDGDEDPLMIRRSKAFGIIANQARLRDLLARHADHADDPRHPEDRVAAHQADPEDPWAADDLPAAGWETADHGNYHHPGFYDLDDLADSRAGQTEPADDDHQPEPTTADADRAWNHTQNDRFDGRPGSGARAGAGDEPEASAASNTGHDSSEPARAGLSRVLPAAFDRSADADESDDPADQPDHCRGCACGSTFDLRPLSKAELNACRTRAVVYVHVSDTTLIDQHGVLRTEYGPVTLEQFRCWLTDADPNLTIRPVLDPAAVAPVDAYEIPQAIRDAVHTRHPGSIWPHSPAATISPRGRLDLDHLTAYRKNGPPGQTAVNNLGPLARSEHRAKTIGNWQIRHPDQRAYLWRSPHGHITLVTNQGTLMLGDSPWAQAIWHTAQPAQSDQDAA